MSIHEDQSDLSSVICPYCKYEDDREAEDYSEDSRVQECYNCKKKFYTRDESSVTHHTTPDCTLNGDEHDYQDSIHRPSVFAHCQTCGKVKMK